MMGKIIFVYGDGKQEHYGLNPSQWCVVKDLVAELDRENQLLNPKREVI